MSLTALSKAEGWELVYKASNNINFAAFDYITVKQSIVDYIRTYHPESFTDFIESSELIALIESFAYVCELMAYRFDMTAHENTIEWAKRKDMVLRMVKLISYNSSRVECASGLVKVDSISTTERLVDSKGTPLSNVTIKWNDVTNSNWKEQFFVIFNRISQQKFGDVPANQRMQYDGVLYELYNLNVPMSDKGTLPINVTVNNKNVQYEVVPVDLIEAGPVERDPVTNGNFSVLYGTDGLGDDSSFTGLFMLIKQGTLYKTMHTLNSAFRNQTIEPNAQSINNTDVWLYQYVNGDRLKWIDITSVGTNVSFNTLKQRTKYTVQTMVNDGIKLEFGDGTFADNPSGSFELWYRVSDPVPTYIPKNAIQRRTVSLNYYDQNGKPQTITIVFSLAESIQNGARSEDIERIRNVAPKVYSTQDRMVTGFDYNNLPLAYPSILKVKTVNRTFAGDSLIKNSIDRSDTYNDVKVFGQDGWFYEYDEYGSVIVTSSNTPERVIQNIITPILADIGLLQYCVINDICEPLEWRLSFSDNEISSMVTSFKQITSPWPISMKFDGDDWSIERNATNDDWLIFIDKTDNEYNIQYKTKHLVFQSANVRFFDEVDGDPIYTLQSAASKMDNVKLLKANVKYRNDVQLLDGDLDYKVIGSITSTSGLGDNGIPYIDRLRLSTYDISGDMIPDNISQRDLFDQIVYFENPNGQDVILETIPYLSGSGDVDTSLEIGYIVRVMDGNQIILDNPYGIMMPHANDDVIISSNVYKISSSLTQPDGSFLITINTDSVYTSFGYTITLDGILAGDKVVPKYFKMEKILVPVGYVGEVRIPSYVYFKKVGEDYIVDNSEMIFRDWALGIGNIVRRRGRGMFNFMWTHRVPGASLVNPSPTNIHDMFVITTSYYNNIIDWLSGRLNARPKTPSVNSLRLTYGDLLEKRMMSDTVIMVPGKVKILFGTKSDPELRAKFVVVRNPRTVKTDNEIKREIVNRVNRFFNASGWEMGDTFYFSLLEADVVGNMSGDISQFNIVPLYPTQSFGDLMQIRSREDEMLLGFIEDADVELISELTPQNLGR